MVSIPALPTRLLLISLFAVGCDRNIEPFVEGEKPRLPDLVRIFPESAPDERSTSPQAVPLPAADGSPPPGRQRQLGVAVRGSADEPGESITGTVAVLPELVDGLPPTGSLFVIARPRGAAAGPPLAVLRISGPRFPVSFEIGPENVMIPSLVFEGEIEISARLDSDGDAMTQLPGDLSGAANAPYAPGASGVDIVLDTRI